MSDGALTRSILYNPPVQHFSGSALARFRRPLLCQPYFCPRCATAPEAVLLVPIVGGYPPKIRADSRPNSQLSRRRMCAVLRPSHIESPGIYTR